MCVVWLFIIVIYCFVFDRDTNKSLRNFYQSKNRRFVGPLVNQELVTIEWNF